MEQIIKNLLTEMTLLGEEPFEKIILKDAYEKLGFEELYNLIRWILHWQKNIYNEKSIPNEDFQKDRFILSDAHQRRFPKLFEYCPELKNIYTLHTDKITFNESLSTEDINEVLDFIDKHHTIVIRKRRASK